LPTKTYYGTFNIKPDNSTKHSVVCFRNAKDASHVYKSLGIYKHRNNKYPKENQIHISNNNSILDKQYDELFVEEQTINESFLAYMTSHDLNLLIVDEIRWMNELSINQVYYKHISRPVEFDELMETIDMDYNILIE